MADAPQPPSVETDQVSPRVRPTRSNMFNLLRDFEDARSASAALIEQNSLDVLAHAQAHLRGFSGRLRRIRDAKRGWMRRRRRPDKDEE